MYYFRKYFLIKF
jgi:hypothetical protein